MRLRTKIFFSIIPIVGVALFITGWLVIEYTTRVSHDAIYRYSEGILKTYFSQDLAKRADILKKKELDAVPSFVSRYQEEALGAACKLNLIWPGHLFIVDSRKNVIYCSSGSMPNKLPEVWEPVFEKVVHKRDALKGHLIGDKYESFVAQYFAPWNWVAVITIHGDFLYEKEREIWFAVILVGIIASIAIVISLGMLLNKLVVTPVTHLRAATELIAMKERPVTIPVKVVDELGDLSRDIEGMSVKIHQSREALKRAYDDLKNMDEMKSVLITNVSHELRTPLTSIVGFAKLGLKKMEKQPRERQSPGSRDMTEKRDAVLRDALSLIVDQGESMSEMIDSIIALMSLIGEKTTAEMHGCDIVEFVSEVMGERREKVEAKGLSFLVSLPSEPLSVNMDAALIKLVLSHYLSNAITFTDDGRIEVIVTKDHNEAVVEVLDTGVGMSPEDAERAFDQFYQAGDVMTEKPKGLGVGLSICQKILALHGGRVWLASIPGKGSSFYFALPLVETEG